MMKKPKLISLGFFAVLLLFVSTTSILPSFAATSTLATCSVPTISPTYQVIHTSKGTIAKIHYCTPSGTKYQLKEILVTRPNGLTRQFIVAKSTGILSYNVIAHGTYAFRFEWTVSGSSQLTKTATVLSET